MKPAARFNRYALRTKHIAAAREFYPAVFGNEFWGEDFTLEALPEQAAARGAPAHWLGQLQVQETGDVAGRLIALGAQRLGPPGAADRIILRDPFGALLALSTDGAAVPRPLIAWHYLHTVEWERAFATYSELFGWVHKETINRGDAGRQRVFAWNELEPSVGSVTDAARQPNIHSQWLFCFRTSRLDDSIAKVRAAGGVALEPISVSSSARMAACEDAQGAAFGLYQA